MMFLKYRVQKVMITKSDWVFWRLIYFMKSMER